MKRIFLFALMLVFICVAASGCGKKNAVESSLQSQSEINSAFEALIGDDSEDKLAVVILENIAPKRENIKNCDIYERNKTGEEFLIIPRYSETKIKIEEIELRGEEFITKSVVYNKQVTPDDYALYLKAIVPEGMPNLRVYISSPKGEGEYIFSFDGRGIRGAFEYITTQPSELFSKEKKFSLDEIKTIFALSEQDITAIYGKEADIQQVDFAGITATEMTYYETKFYLEYESGNQNSNVYYAVLSDDKIAAPRGITIGEGYESVIRKFRRLSNWEKGTLVPTEENMTYRLLYGEYMHKSDYGAVLYRGIEPVMIRYASRDGRITFMLENKRVSKIEYLVSIL